MTVEGGSQRQFRLVLALVAAITLLRIAVLIASPLELYPDEAQYWWWAQSPDLGYFSKPPLIAWIIRGTTLLFGDREWAIRLAMPLLHAGAALLLYGTAQRVETKDRRVGFWSALAYLTLPGVSYSATLASTDAPLLFFWALALFALMRSVVSPSWRWPILCGFAVGLGLLAKYAMFFFPAGLVLALGSSRQLRAALFGRRWLAALLVAAATVAPNIVWNASHGFATVAHTQTNADWSHASFSLGHLAGFLAGQFGVFGPVLMAAWLAALLRILRQGAQSPAQAVLAGLSAPIFGMIAIQAFVADANANWAATAYVAAVPLAIAELRTRWPRPALGGSFVLHGMILALVCVVEVRPAAADRVALGNVLKREEGWKAMADQVSAAVDAGHYPLVAASNRSVTAELLYYMRGHAGRLRIWDADLDSHNHFEMTMRLVAPAPRVLLVVSPEDAADVRPTFESTRFAGSISVPVGGHHMRTVQLFDARGYRGPMTRS